MVWLSIDNCFNLFEVLLGAIGSVIFNSVIFCRLTVEQLYPKDALPSKEISKILRILYSFDAIFRLIF